MLFGGIGRTKPHGAAYFRPGRRQSGTGDLLPDQLENLLLAGGEITVAPLLTHRFPLASIDAALAAHRDPASIKVAVFPGAAPA